MERIEPGLESERTFWLLAAVMFALLACLMYFPALFGKVPFPRDMVFQFPAWAGSVRSEGLQTYADIGDLAAFFYPARAFAARALRAGTLPLWNPYFLGGAPFLASSQSALFYPPNLLYSIVALPTAWTLCMILRVFIAGMFMTLFVRSIGGSRAGSVFSGIVFTLCGFMTAWQGQPMDDGAAWLPFVCYAVIRLQKSPSGFSMALAAIGFAMPVLAGHPETAAHVTLVCAALALATWICSRLNLKFLLRFTVAGLLAMGLASIQMLPTLEWLGQMPSALKAVWPVLPFHQLFGWVTRDVIRGPNSAGVWIPEAAAYVGMITLLAAPLGLLHRARRHSVFLAVTAAAGFAGTYGIQPVHWLISQTPVLSGLKNGRMILIAGFGAAALAGLGISTLEEDVPFSRERRAIALALITAAFLLTFLAAYKLQLATEFRIELLRRASFSRALLIAGVVPILWRLYGGLSRRTFAVGAGVLVAFDLITFGYSYTGFAARDEVFPRAQVFDFLSKNGGTDHFRIAQLGLAYTSNANIVYSLASADGYEVRLTPPQQIQSQDFIDNQESGIKFTAPGLLRSTDRRFDMLNVKYLVTGTRSPEFEQFIATKRFPLAYNNGYVAVFENKSVLPRAFTVPVSGVEVLQSVDEQLGRLKNPAFDPEKSVIVSWLPASLKEARLPGIAHSLPFGNAVDILESGINEVGLHAAISVPSLLVLSQTYYPGWKATLDGRDTEVFPVNIALTGISVPAGTHEIRFAFEPLSFKLGAGVTLIAAMILALQFMSKR